MSNGKRSGNERIYQRTSFDLEEEESFDGMLEDSVISTFDP